MFSLEKQSECEKTGANESISKSDRLSSSRRVIRSESTNRSIATRTTGQTLIRGQKKNSGEEFDKGLLEWKLFFEPNPAHFHEKSHNLIEFSSHKESSYTNLIARYKKILQEQYVTKAKSCNEQDEASNSRSTSASVCRVERENNSSLGYGECALTMENLEETHMGFKSGEPCIMLRLTKNNATVEILPINGIGSCAFPFWNQPEYQQPFAMLKLRNLSYGRTELRCYAKHEKLARLDDGSMNEVKMILDRKQN
uniref:Uncharacterized protein n=1 Tax=Heterorhabditis bacteriophora TaxID=37862 RepID=A0A1I7WMW5_HETBA